MRRLRKEQGEVSGEKTVLVRMRDARLRALQRTGPVVAGSLVKNKKTAGYVLTDKVKGKTRTMYVSKQMYGQAKEWNENHREAKRLLEELSEIQRALMKLESQKGSSEG